MKNEKYNSKNVSKNVNLFQIQLNEKKTAYLFIWNRDFTMRKK